MTLNQLRYVLEVAKYPSMREAANQLFITQPALSSSIRDLENELGMLLFERTKNGIILTNEGEAFLADIKKVISQFEILEDKYLSQEKKIHFSVSSQHYNFAAQALAQVVKSCDCESYVFSIHETRTANVLENVRKMTSEIGILSFSGENEQLIKKLMKEYQLEFHPLMMRDAYAYFWKGHEFAERKVISLEELRDYPCITFEQNNDRNYYLSEEALASYDFKKLIKSDDRATSMELIATLGGFSIGSGMLSEEDGLLKGLVSVKLEEDDPLTIGYIKRKGIILSELGARFERELLKYKEI